MIRHLDRFKMNNGNTEGEAIFVRNTATYDPPINDDPVPGSLRWLGEPVQVAQASTGTMTDFGSNGWFSSNTATAQASGQSAGNVAGGTRSAGAGTAPAPTSTIPKVPSLSDLGKGLLSRTGLWGLALQEIWREASMSPDERAAEARAMMAILSKPAQNVIVQNKLLSGHQPTTFSNLFSSEAWKGKYGFIINDEDRIPLANDILSSLARRPIDVRTATAEEVQGILQGRDVANPQTYEESKKNVEALAKSNVRVAAESISKGACLVGPHNLISKICPGESHHIVPDMTLGWGDRSQRMAGQTRISGAPSFQNGMAICLLKQWHTGLHQSLNKELDALGQQHVPTGTAPMIRIVRAATISIDSIKELPEKCKEIAKAAALSQMLPIMSKPGRTTVSLPSNEAIEVMKKGHY